MSLDSDALLARSERAYAWISAESADGFLPLYVRDHFNYDVPELIALVRSLQGRLAELNGEATR